MTRAPLVLVPAVSISLAAATFAQTARSPNDKCGPETRSTDQMTYVTTPRASAGQ